MTTRNIAIRLGGEGAPQVKRMFDDLAAHGDASMRRLARSVDRTGQDVEEAAQRHANAVAKAHAAFGAITPLSLERLAGNRDDVGRSAEASASVFTAAYAKMESRARALVLAIDPVAAAQDRFNREMQEARDLVTAGVLSSDAYAAKLEHEQQALDRVTAALKRKSAAEQGVTYGGIDAARVQAIASTALDVGRSAEASASVFAEHYERMEARARALVLALDPVAAAQDRFNREVGEARELVGAGVLSLDQYCDKLRQEKGLLDQVAAAHGRTGQMSGQHRAAIQNVGFQLQDFAVQVAGGQSALLAFAQQFPQAAGAVSGLGGKAAGFASFMGGPWGIGLTVAVAALVPLIGKLLETGTSVDDLVRKMREDAVETAKAAQAKDIYSRSLEGVIEKQKALNAELARERMTQQQVAQGRLDESRSALGQQAAAAIEAGRAVRTARRAMEQAKKEAETASATGTDETGSAQAAYARSMREYRDAVQRYQTLTRTAVETQTAVRDAEMAISERRVAASLDAGAAAAERFEAALGKLRQQRSQGLITGSQFELSLKREAQIRDAAVKEAQDRANAENRRTSLGSQLTTERGSSLLVAASQYKGLTENTPGGRSELQALFRSAGMNVDPKMVAWCAAFVNAVLATNGLPGTGSLSARSFLEYGTATTKPEQGDIVVLKRGNSAAQGHVGFYAGTAANGRIMVTGGNQGDAVSTASFARSDVLGFRRAPTEAATFKDAAQQAKDDAAALAELTRKYAPLTAAADAYRATLAEIDRLGPTNAADLKGAARTEYLKTRASLLGDRLGLAGIEAGGRDEQAAIDKATEEAKRRADFVKGMLGDQAEALGMARAELSLVAANDSVRVSTLTKLRLIADLKRGGVEADSAEGALILANAEAYEEVIAQLHRQRAIWDEIRGFGSDFVNTVLSPDTWDDWGDGGKRVLAMLKAEFVKLALLNPVRNMLLGEKNPTLGSIFGALGKLFGAATPAAPAAGGSQGFIGPPGNAAGTHYWSGGMMLAGEFGPELVHAPRGSQVIPAGETRRMLGGGSGGAAGRMQVEVVPTPYFDVRVRRVAAPDIQAGMAQAATVGAAGGAAMGQAEATAARTRRLGRGW